LVENAEWLSATTTSNEQNGVQYLENKMMSTMCCQKIKIHKISRPDRGLFDDIITTCMDKGFTNLSNLKLLVLDAYRTNNSLPWDQRDPSS